MKRLRSTIGLPAMIGLTAVSILLASVTPVLPSPAAGVVPAEQAGTTVGEAVDAALEHAAASSPTSLDGFLAAFVQAYAEGSGSDEALETEATGSMNAGDVYKTFWQGHRTALTRLLAGSASSSSAQLTLSRGDATILHSRVSLTDVQFLSRSCALRLVSFVLSIRSVWSAEPLGP